MRPIALLRIAGLRVQLKNDTPNATATSPANASATCTVASNGNVTATGVLSYKWLLGGVASAFEIRATLQASTGVSTAASPSPFGSFLNLGSNQSWNVVRSGVGTGTAQILLEIRPVGGSVIASATLNFTCDVS